MTDSTVYYFKSGEDLGEDWDEQYEVLFRPNGTKLAVLTEPEDRNFWRDLAPIVTELNAQHDENERLLVALEDIAHNTSSSVPLGVRPESHYYDMMRRAIGIAARALRDGMKSSEHFIQLDGSNDD